MTSLINDLKGIVGDAGWRDDPDALRFQRYVIGIGVLLSPVEAEFLGDRLVITPLDGLGAPWIPLPPGQYTVVVGPEARAANEPDTIPVSTAVKLLSRK